MPPHGDSSPVAPGPSTERAQEGEDESRKDEKMAPRKKPLRRSSVYIFGPVGTGKTMLLNMFHEQAKMNQFRVKRRHFSEFMLDLHKHIHKTTATKPVETVANMFADDTDILCFDEFQITDIQDAVILPRVLEVFFLRGVIVVATSNTAPSLLYKGGLNRHVYIPEFVKVVMQHCQILSLVPRGGGPVKDYRRLAESSEIGDSSRSGNYLSGPDADKKLDALWSNFLEATNSSAQARDLTLPMGRTLRLSRTAGNACLVKFHEISEQSWGDADHLALAEHFKFLLLGGVPTFDRLESTDDLRRFVKLLDVLYDTNVHLVVAAVAPIPELFDNIRADISKGDINDLAWRTALYSSDGKAGLAPSAVGTLYEAVRAADRAESRLREMRTRHYWERCDQMWGSTHAETPGWTWQHSQVHARQP